MACCLGIPSEITPSLGVPSGLDVSLKDMKEWVLHKIEKTLSYWYTKSFSLPNKIQVVRRFLVATHAHCFTPKSNYEGHTTCT